jgi:hypothetical protein
MKFTPGPWHTGTNEDSNIVYDSSCGFVADVTRDDGAVNEEVANARLIAESPTLFAIALRALEYAPNEVEADVIRKSLARIEGR